jgi:hypothetical protein
VNGVEVRDPFPNNVIPQALFDRAAAKYDALLPDPAFNRLLNNRPTYASTSPLDTETVLTTKEEYDRQVSILEQDFLCGLCAEKI